MNCFRSVRRTFANVTSANPRLLVHASIVALALAAAVASASYVQPDYMPSRHLTHHVTQTTVGVSIVWTPNDYCTLDLVAGRPVPTCEVAQ